jgi:6-phosphogluconolactonase
MDKTGQWIFVGNYTGGNLSVAKINKDGSIKQPHQVIQHYGSGPDKSRQEKPHVHSVNISPDNKCLVVADLGTDQLINYSFDSKTGKLTESQKIKVSDGSGPRHFVFHQTLPYAYLIQELTGKVSVFSYKNGKLKFIEEVSSLPDQFDGKNSSADIHISKDGKYLYASNRYYDTVVGFTIDQITGKVTQLGQTSTKGNLPRNFGITPDGKYMLVANQGTDNVVVFKLENGKMIDLGLELSISMPVCVKFL